MLCSAVVMCLATTGILQSFGMMWSGVVEFCGNDKTQTDGVTTEREHLNTACMGWPDFHTLLYWANQKMDNVQKGIWNVACPGVVRTVAGESSHPSWLHLLFGVVSPLCC